MCVCVCMCVCIACMCCMYACVVYVCIYYVVVCVRVGGRRERTCISDIKGHINMISGDIGKF